MESVGLNWNEVQMMDVCTGNWSNLIGQGNKRSYGKMLDVALQWKEKSWLTWQFPYVTLVVVMFSASYV